MTSLPTTFESAMLRIRARGRQRRHDRDPGPLQRIEAQVCRPQALEILARLQGTAQSFNRPLKYKKEPWRLRLERLNVAAYHEAAGIDRCAQTSATITALELETAYHALKSELESGRTSDHAKRRAHYITYVKSYHPDLVPSALQRRACRLLAELNHLISATD